MFFGTLSLLLGCHCYEAVPMPLRSLPVLTPDGVIVEVAANPVASERSSLFIFIVSYIILFPCPFGCNGRLVSHPLSEDACISVLAALLLQVCSNLAAKTMRKGRNHLRNPPRNDTTG